jgi:hypothetical protein
VGGEVGDDVDEGRLARGERRRERCAVGLRILDPRRLPAAGAGDLRMVDRDGQASVWAPNRTSSTSF